MVNSRPHYDITNLSNETKALLKQRQVNNLADIGHCLAGHIFVQQHQHYNISSTELRAQLIKHPRHHEQLPDFILNYIQQEQLYR